MAAGWAAFVASLTYICLLFGVAQYGEVSKRFVHQPMVRKVIYSLGLCVFCSSWTLFGSVGLASSSGWDFVPVYLGPILMFTFGQRMLVRILRLAKTQNAASVADFLGARYGKSVSVAVAAACVAIVAVVPYAALQLRVIAESLLTVSQAIDGQPVSYSLADAWPLEIMAAIVLAFFAIIFGARRLAINEHQAGLMLAIGAESLLKLLAVLMVGIYVVYFMGRGFGDLFARIGSDARIGSIFTRWPNPFSWLVIASVSAFAVVLLPRQFYVAIVENHHEADLRTARWLFPAYMVAINLFVAPLAIAGLAVFPGNEINRDMTILALPLHAGAGTVALIAMVGGFSAAAAMVIVASVALSVMVSNNLIMPLLLRLRATGAGFASGDLSVRIIAARRLSIAAMLALSCLYLRYANEVGLAQNGLRSFSAIAQLAPAFIGGLFWSRGNARGALAGIGLGMLVWAWTLLAPELESSSGAGGRLLDGDSSFEALPAFSNYGFGAPDHMVSVVVSLAVNVLAYIGFSLSRRPTQIEMLQASIFVEGNAAPADTRYRLWHATITRSELEAAVARYLGKERTRQAFAEFGASRSNWPAPDAEVDLHMMQFAEQMLTSVIGAASSRLVLSLALQQRNLSRKAALDLADETSAAIHYNRDLLQHAIDFARQGISIFDKDMRLVFWNRGFEEMCQFPKELMQYGVTLGDLIRHHAKRGLYGPGQIEAFVEARLKFMANTVEPYRLSYDEQASVIELRSSAMPDGGLVVTYTDVSQQVEAERALAQINETLERRVAERTEELQALNIELSRAKAAADDANLSKTRFLAAASHDILQPLNAARLFATALTERVPDDVELTAAKANEASSLARNIDASLESVEEILTTLLDMSRLDAGAMKPELTTFRIDEIFAQLALEFEPVAQEKQLRLTFVPCRLWIRSDRRLMRRLLQNLVSNAIKYTPKGRVLVGCRRQRRRLSIEVWDTGLGIPDNKRKAVFREFERLDAGARSAKGLGLGLSIVERLARVLNVKVALRSEPGRGSVFSVETAAVAALPVAAGKAGEAAAGRPRYQPLAGMVVVAIDNEPRILEGMQILLGGWGCRVITADSASGAQAALAAAGLSPAAIIADYHLGDSAGIDAVVQLRAQFGNIPAILLTADRSQSVRLEAESKDIKLLNKPLKPAALRSLLSQWFGARMAAE